MKTLSDTPRTDAEDNWTWKGLRDLCRQLERELAQADRRIDQLEHCSEIETYAAAEARIAELERENSRLKEALEEAAVQLAAFDSHHCESEGCAVEGLYKPIAAEWADKYHAMKKRIAELERELAEANDELRMVAYALAQRGCDPTSPLGPQVAELVQCIAELERALEDEETRANHFSERVTKLERKLWRLARSATDVTD